MLKYKTMNLFDAPAESVLVHACNAKGVWGSGIAAEFHRRYPKAYKEYNRYCKNFGLVGTAPIVAEGDTRIGCLITSSGYADTLDAQAEILVNTTLALNAFCSNEYWAHFGKREIYSNRFNSGLFRVPWSETERILKVFVERFDLDWTVCDHK